MSVGQLLNHRYYTLKVLGTDAVSVTYLTRDTQQSEPELWIMQEFLLPHLDPALTQWATRLLTHKVENFKEVMGNHAQIAKIQAHFCQNQQFYVVEELVRGQTLAAELLGQQPQPQSRVLQLLREVLAILEFVHNRGLMFCCLQPNEMIRQQSNGRLIWTGFGVLKHLCRQLAQAALLAGGGSVRLAEAADGITLYHAPEYHQGQCLPSSDFYTLGVMAIQALTGQPLAELFQPGPTAPTLQLTSHWKQAASIHPQLAAVLERMVQLQPQARYASATEIVEAIAHF